MQGSCQPVPESFLLHGRAQGLGILEGKAEAETDNHTRVSIPAGRQRINGYIGSMVGTRDRLFC